MSLEIHGFDTFVAGPVAKVDFYGFMEKAKPENKFDIYDSSKERRYDLSVFKMSNRSVMFTSALSAKVGDISWCPLIRIGELRNDSGITEQFIQVPVIPLQPEGDLTLIDLMRFDTRINQWNKFTTGSIGGSRLHIASVLAQMGVNTVPNNLPECADIQQTMNNYIDHLNAGYFVPPVVVGRNPSSN